MTPNSKGHAMTDNAVICIRDLNIGFHDRQQTWRPVLRGIDLTLGQGEILGLVGESGSGKSTLATAMLGLLRRGSLVRTGEVSIATPAPASSATAHDKRSQDKGSHDRNNPLHDKYRSLSFHHQPGRWLGELKLGLVSQHAEKAMTPHLTLGSLLCETLLSQGVKGKAAREQQAVAWLRRVHLPYPEVLMQRYPHQLSGGQQQRASLALALAQRPRVLVMDEPTTGLDASIQNEILALLASLRAELGMSIVFVSHDLGAVSHLCDRVAVMYAGQLVEVAATRDFLSGPRHPYGHALVAATPGSQCYRPDAALEGTPPLVGSAIKGCAFAPRCTRASELCRDSVPAWQGRYACHHALESHESVERARAESGKSAESDATTDERADSVKRDSQPATSLDAAPLLAVESLNLCYRTPGWLARLRGEAASLTVSDVAFSLQQGETLALIGESGSGKTSILKALAGLLSPVSGQLSLRQESLAGLVAERCPVQRQKIQYIFQHASTALNPRLTVFESLAPVLSRWLDLSGDVARQRAQSLLEEVRLPALYLDRLPNQLSGGEQQRVAIARALAAEPDILLCDEITSALDVSVQATIIRLLQRLKRERGLSLVFVTHDLGLVSHFADRVLVLRNGRTEHLGDVASLAKANLPPYVRTLMEAKLVAA